MSSITPTREDVEQTEIWSRLADALPHIVWTTNPAGEAEYLNRQWVEYAGLPVDVSRGGGWQQAIHPDDLAICLRRWNHSIRTGQLFEVEYRLRRKDGVFRWHIGRALPVRDSDETIVKWFGTCTDIDDQKEASAELARALDALRASELRFRRLVDSNLIGVCHWNMDGRVIEANDEFLRLLGHTRDELIAGQVNWRQATASGYEAADAQCLAELKIKGVATPYEKDYLHKNGRRVSVLIGPALVDPEKDEGIAFAIDLTQRKEAEQALSQSNQDLQQFAFVASHDLQEPLRMVTSYTQLIARRFGPQLGPEAAEFMGFITQGVNRMSALIRDLLEFSRLGFSEIKPAHPTSLLPILEWAEMNLQVAIRECGAVITCSGLPTVSVDQMQMLQLFQNLIGNAIKYRSDAPPRIRVAAERHGDDWVITITDNGIGFDPAYAEQIFVVFKRLHGRDSDGTGLGLAICKRIVERHGGRIWATSKPGEGSTFYFTLPAD